MWATGVYSTLRGSNQFMPEGSSPKRVTTDSKANQPANCSESATNPAAGNSCWCQISTERWRCLQRSKWAKRVSGLPFLWPALLSAHGPRGLCVYRWRKKEKLHLELSLPLWRPVGTEHTKPVAKVGESSASQESSKLRHGCFKQRRQYAGGSTRGKQWHPFICRRSKVWVWLIKEGSACY